LSLVFLYILGITLLKDTCLVNIFLNYVSNLFTVYHVFGCNIFQIFMISNLFIFLLLPLFLP
jgi:hypothetical protein